MSWDEEMSGELEKAWEGRMRKRRKVRENRGDETGNGVGLAAEAAMEMPLAKPPAIINQPSGMIAGNLVEQPQLQQHRSPSPIPIPTPTHLSSPPPASPSSIRKSPTDPIIISISSQSSSSAQPQPQPQRPTNPSTKPPKPLTRAETLPAFTHPPRRKSSTGPTSAAYTKLLKEYAKWEKGIRQKKGAGAEKQGVMGQGKVLEGCVLAVYMSPAAAGSTALSKWNVIHTNGGHPVIQYSPQVTHVIIDVDVTDADTDMLVKFLGIESKSDIRAEVPVVTWSWVSQSVKHGQKEPTGFYLTWKRPTPAYPGLDASRIPGAGGAQKRKADDVLEAVRVGKKKPQREIDPTDSDTLDTQSAHIPQPQPQPLRIPASAPTPDPSQKSTPPHQSRPPLASATSRSSAGTNGNDTDMDKYKERFGLEAGVAADPLDQIILGVKEGTMDLSDEEEEGPPVASREQRKKRRDYDSDEDGTDDDDKSKEAEEGRKLRELARREAAKRRRLKTSTSDRPYKAQQAHDGIKPPNPNEDIAKALEELGNLYKDALFKTEWQRRAYMTSANILRTLPYRIESYEQAMEIKGLGDSMAKRIEEYLQHGRTLRAMYEDTPENRAVEQFGKIYGVGPTVANGFVRKGARNIDDLRRDPDKYGLTEGHKLGLVYYDDLNERIPRDEVTALFEVIKRAALQIDDKLVIDPMGSYRRGEPDSGDLDILMTRDPSDGVTHAGIIEKLVRNLVHQKIIHFSIGAPHDWKALECKWMGAGKLTPDGKMRRIDILAIPHEQYGVALIYFTGNDRFNRSLRLYANRNGYSLNQRGLYKGVVRDANRKKLTEGVLVASRTEQDIFDVLGIRYRPPHLRRP